MKSKLLVLGASVMCLTGLTGCSSEFAVEMEHAGLNTLLGMGMAFFVLIIISLVISCFPLFLGGHNKKEVKKTEKITTEQAIDHTISQIEEQEEMADDAELVAVISAAIAAFEDTSHTEGFQVRSIRKVNKRNWKK